MIGFGGACVALAISAAVSYRNIQEISRSEAMVVHTHEVIDSLNVLLSSIKDAETGQRGYIITGDKDYLLPYHASRIEIDRLLTQLEGLTIDNEVQLERSKELQESIEARLQSLAQGVKLREEQGFEQARDHVLQGFGKSQMRAIRAKIEEMLADETSLLVERTAESSTTYATSISTLFISTGVGLAMVVVAFVLASREIANRRRTAEILERRVQERTAELNQLNAALQISNRELEQFASVASHDLQEPLRKIEAFGDRLKSRHGAGLDESGRDFLERILLSASRMRSLINDLLSFSRVTTRAQPHEKLDLNRIAREVVSDLEGRMQQVQGTVELGELPTIEADPLQLRQLFQNLIGNALKFHRPNVPPVVQVEGKVTNPAVGVPYCTLTVKDNGIGFEEVYLDRIFNVFQRLHGRNEYEGTGMGLAIARKIVERHRGTITATSKLEEGSTFIITLPVAQPEEERKPA